MRASLVSREVIADSIELVCRGHLFDGLVQLVRLRQDESRRGDGDRAPRHPGDRLLHRLDRARASTGSARSRSGTSTRGSAPTRQGRSRDAELHELESAACPGAGRLRRAVHGEHDVDDPRLPRALAARRERHPGDARRRRRRPPTRSAGSPCSSCATTSRRARS